MVKIIFKAGETSETAVLVWQNEIENSVLIYAFVVQCGLIT